MSKKQVEDVIFEPSDCYLTPKECLKYGITDRIASPWEIEDGVGGPTRPPKKTKTKPQPEQ